MPRVVPDQRNKFENEEFFRKLSRECEIKYTGFRDRPHEERQARFQNACRDGRSEVAFVATGTNLSLQFFPANLHGDQRQVPTRDYVDFERETGKVGGICLCWVFSLIYQQQTNISVASDNKNVKLPQTQLHQLLGHEHRWIWLKVLILLQENRKAKNRNAFLGSLPAFFIRKKMALSLQNRWSSVFISCPSSYFILIPPWDSGRGGRPSYCL
uniref:Core-binding factor subunit beta n=1 Tax=Nothobranchius furzeri TaxID=105023 RepID=A0A8C6M6N9_NOTFU